MALARGVLPWPTSRVGGRRRTDGETFGSLFDVPLKMESAASRRRLRRSPHPRVGSRGLEPRTPRGVVAWAGARRGDPPCDPRTHAPTVPDASSTLSSSEGGRRASGPVATVRPPNPRPTHEGRPQSATVRCSGRPSGRSCRRVRRRGGHRRASRDVPGGAPPGACERFDRKPVQAGKHLGLRPGHARGSDSGREAQESHGCLPPAQGGCAHRTSPMDQGLEVEPRVSAVNGGEARAAVTPTRLSGRETLWRASRRWGGAPVVAGTRRSGSETR